MCLTQEEKKRIVQDTIDRLQYAGDDYRKALEKLNSEHQVRPLVERMQPQPRPYGTIENISQVA